MKKFIITALAVVLLGTAGCGKKYDHREEKRSEEEVLRRELSQALDQGKAVVFSKDSRRSIWVSADKAQAFAFHQELPSIGPYVAQVVEPGTYYFAGGKVEVTQPKQQIIDRAEATKTVDNVGKAHMAQMIRDQRTAEYAYRTLPVYYGSSIGYGRGYWGGRRGHWGRRHYDAPFYGMSMHTDSERTVRSKVAVHSQTSVWSNSYVITLPNDGRTGTSVKPGVLAKSDASGKAGASAKTEALVASVTIAPGEAVLLDDVFISRVDVDIPQEIMESQKRVLPASASSASSAVITDQSGPFPVTGLEITVIPHDRAALPLIGGLSAPVQEDRQITRGTWLKKQAEGIEKAVIVQSGKARN